MFIKRLPIILNVANWAADVIRRPSFLYDSDKSRIAFALEIDIGTCPKPERHRSVTDFFAKFALEMKKQCPLIMQRK